MLKEFDRINTLQLYNHTLMNFTNVFLEAMRYSIWKTDIAVIYILDQNKKRWECDDDFDNNYNNQKKNKTEQERTRRNKKKNINYMNTL